MESDNYHIGNLISKMNHLGIILLFVFNIIFLPNAVSQNRINVKNFGAKGDGMNNDTKAIYAAIKSLKNNDILYFPSGIYLTNVIDIKLANSFTNMTVEGENKNTTVIKKSSTDVTKVAVFFCEQKNYNISFNNITVDGNLQSNNSKWIFNPKNKKAIILIERINGIYGYNLSSLHVKNCIVKDCQGEGVAAYSTDNFIVNNVTVSQTLSSGIKGHRVNSMIITNNDISNCGLLPSKFYVNGKFITNNNQYVAQFGDGIESEAANFEAKNNNIRNCGRAGIVHDLAKDLNYSNSKVIVENNMILVNSLKIKNGNPPAGMWFEQTANVVVKDNKLDIIQSSSPLISGIRFFDITDTLSCINNQINIKNYNNNVIQGIAIMSSQLQYLNIQENNITGKFLEGISISSSKNSENIGLNIQGNTIVGDASVTKYGIAYASESNQNFPRLSNITNNTISSVQNGISYYYYGKKTKMNKKASILQFNNIINGKNQINIIAPIEVNIINK